MSSKSENFFDSKVLGHPSGLFVLFFTEMWERFSFYGMRVLLIQFLTAAVIGLNPGWEWSIEKATALYGTYAMLLYITPIFGGIIADKYIGYRWAVVVGAIIMTFGHAFMAFDTPFFLYLGLACLVIGTGFFKPNMTSILSEMYKDFPEKKDGAYTIFYMGVNAGAFFGMMLCGFLAEKVGWHWGFGLAGIFMLLGTLQFWLAKPLFGRVGEVPSKQNLNEKIEDVEAKYEPGEKANPFTLIDQILIVLMTVLGLGYAFNDPLSAIGGINLFPFSIGPLSGQNFVIIVALVLFFIVVIRRLANYTKIVRDRMIAVIIFAFFVIFFWMSFEQGATSLVIFARDFTERNLTGGAAMTFNIFNTLLTVVPLILISYVLVLLAKQTMKKAFWSNIVLAITFLGIWAAALWMLNYNWSSHSYDVAYQSIQTPKLDDKNVQVLDEEGKPVFNETPITASYVANATDKIVTSNVNLASQDALTKDAVINIHKEGDKFVLVTPADLIKLDAEYKKESKPSEIIPAKVAEIKDSQVEITVSWFSTLNSFFIIALASLVSRVWDSKYNPSAAVKYGLGLIIMAIGFGCLAFGSYGIAEGVRVSIIWLVLAYLFHTLGELCLSPVGLSYVSKLVPARMIAFMFGMWYLAIAIGNKLAAILGGQIENITKEYSLSTFFLIFTIVPIVAGLLVMALNPVLKKLMHGVK
ncbi:proton-dependent oligopeptide transporter, POT family [Algoriella xinjiangensis]|uniref:Proton-dependent oligopeptide transporter, POT family n=1 Tax=Algoriella xinjiangensis TaxID=684065 RepID=A0A1I4XMR1_9FLAO|nr:peptide MFS transporter [Algoriella xinjiangensis]SFN26693.1 proton-dependent oligopeptide transporter, POT family [Algoriella xinjiangensis]VDH17703.1 Probable dipeptide and tripeptide permease YjdL [Algoriella xinjiangensis]